MVTATAAKIAAPLKRATKNKKSLGQVGGIFSISKKFNPRFVVHDGRGAVRDPESVPRRHVPFRKIPEAPIGPGVHQQGSRKVLEALALPGLIVCAIGQKEVGPRFERFDFDGLALFHRGYPMPPSGRGQMISATIFSRGFS